MNWSPPAAKDFKVKHFFPLECRIFLELETYADAQSGHREIDEQPVRLRAVRSKLEKIGIVCDGERWFASSIWSLPWSGD